MGLEGFLWRFSQQVSYENYFISLHFDNAMRAMAHTLSTDQPQAW